MGASCRGVCSINPFGDKGRPKAEPLIEVEFGRNRPNLGQGGLPYLTHGFCRTCDVWIARGNGWGEAKNRCPCCHTMLSFKPRQSKNKKRYRKLRMRKEIEMQKM